MSEIIHLFNDPNHSQDWLQQIANKYHFQLIDKLQEDIPTLIFRERWQLVVPKDWGNFSPLSFNFINELNYHLAQNYALSKEPLAKCIGHKKDISLRIFDGGCGVGKDSCFFLFLGHQVWAQERHPVVAFLLDQARTEALKHPHWGPVIEQNFQLLFIDEQPTQKENGFDVIYFDPMYPMDPKRTAKSKKEMQILALLVGKDEDAYKVFQSFKLLGAKRMVVKRPLRGEELEEGVHFSLKGKSTRYDIYLPPFQAP